MMLFTVTIVVFFLALCYLVQCYRKTKNIFINCNNKEMTSHYLRTPPGNFNVTVMMLQIAAGIGNIYWKDGLVVAWIFFRPVVMVFSAKTIKPLLSGFDGLSKTMDYDLLASWLRTGLLTSNGDKWKARRKTLTPSFHFRILEEFTPIIDKQSQIFLQKLRSLRSKSHVDIYSLVNLLAIDIILETSTGVSINAQSKTNHQYADALKTASECFVYRAIRPYLWSNFIFGLTKRGKMYNRSIAILKDFTKDIIKERKAALKDMENEVKVGKTGKLQLALLDSLLEISKRDSTFTENDVCEEIDTFLFAGQDTTSSTLSFSFYLLGLHPEIQEKIYEEVIDAVGTDPYAPITSDDLKSMKYIECVIKEVHRIYTPAPQIGRVSTQEITLSGHVFPKGTDFWVLLGPLHKNPDVFPDPYKFDPSRFEPENSFGRDPYAFLPFAAGPRNCIGQRFALNSVKLIIASVVRGFKIRSLDPRDKIVLAVEIICKPVNEIRIKFEERSRNSEAFRQI